MGLPLVPAFWTKRAGKLLYRKQAAVVAERGEESANGFSLIPSSRITGFALSTKRRRAEKSSKKSISLFMTSYFFAAFACCTTSVVPVKCSEHQFIRFGGRESC